MIELEGWQLSLLQRLEKENCKKYIKIFENDYYVRIEDLFYCIDDTQDNREYAEDKLQDFIADVEARKEDNTPGLLNSYQKECQRLKEENDELRTTIEAIQSTLNEDDYDKLAEEGIEIYERD